MFKTKFNRKIFDVAMWGDEYSINVNGHEFQENDIFYSIIIPFLRLVQQRGQVGLRTPAKYVTKSPWE